MHMKKKSFLTFITVIAFVFAGFGAKAAVEESDVRGFLNSTGERFIETLGIKELKVKYERLDEMIENSVDVQYMGQFALGRHYRNFNEEQKQKYDALFVRYIKSLYKSYPLDFDTKEINFRISSVEPKGDFFDAICVIDLPEKYRMENFEQVSVVFKLREKNKELFLVDLKIGEASMIVTLRNRFLKMVQDDEEELSWFLEDFEDLVKSNEQSLENLE